MQNPQNSRLTGDGCLLDKFEKGGDRTVVEKNKYKNTISAVIRNGVFIAYAVWFFSAIENQPMVTIKFRSP